MPEDKPHAAEEESLARKLHALAPDLTSGERRLLARVLAAAALSGTMLGLADLAVSVGAGDEAVPTTSGSGVVAAGMDEQWGDIRTQFLDDHTLGVAWETPSTVSIKPPGQQI